MDHSTDYHHDGLVRINIPKNDAAANNAKTSTAGGGWYFFVDQIEDYAWQTNVFSPDEAHRIVTLGESLALQNATIGKGQSSDIRKSEVVFLYPSDQTSWIFDRLCSVAIGLNQQHFQFDLDSFSEGIQFTKYSAPSEHYDWHIDRSWGMIPRKLSLSVQLSNPDSYVGGDLELRAGNGTAVARRELGTVTAFPSFMLHRVSPVTEGVRYSLVAWIAGRPFK